MSDWKAIFRNKKRRKEDEGYACTSCEAKYYEPGCHQTGPPNGICKCPACIGRTNSDKYRENYSAIFGHD